MKNLIVPRLISKCAKIFILIIFLSMSVSIMIVAKNEEETIKYFSRYHSDNPDSFTYETPFTEEINKPSDINRKYYYKVFYRNDKIIKAEQFEDSKVTRTIFFNSDGRRKTEIRGEKTQEIEYGSNKKTIIYKVNETVQLKIVNKYRNDLLYKSIRYDTDNNLLYYTLYDQISWTYKRYDKNDNLIKSGNMMKPGK